MLPPRALEEDAVGLHPLAAMLALVAGFELAGIPGALVAVPVAGVLFALGSASVRRLRSGDAEPLPRRHPSFLIGRSVSASAAVPRVLPLETLGGADGPLLKDAS